MNRLLLLATLLWSSALAATAGTVDTVQVYSAAMAMAAAALPAGQAPDRFNEQTLKGIELRKDDSVVIATGMSARTLDVPGIDRASLSGTTPEGWAVLSAVGTANPESPDIASGFRVHRHRPGHGPDPWRCPGMTDEAEFTPWPARSAPARGATASRPPAACLTRARTRGRPEPGRPWGPAHAARCRSGRRSSPTGRDRR